MGIVLAVVGAATAPLFYFVVGSPPLAATAISAIILGFTCIAISNSRPYLLPEAAQVLLVTPKKEAISEVGKILEFPLVFVSSAPVFNYLLSPQLGDNYDNDHEQDKSAEKQ